MDYTLVSSVAALGLSLKLGQLARARVSARIAAFKKRRHVELMLKRLDEADRPAGLGPIPDRAIQPVRTPIMVSPAEVQQYSGWERREKVPSARPGSLG